MIRAGLAAAFCLWGTAVAAVAQQFHNERLITADGLRLDYPPDGVWRVRARRVAERRTLLRGQGRIGALNAPWTTGVRAAAPELAVVVAGDLRVPSILLSFTDTDTGTLPAPARYDSIFYTTQPLSGRPYTQRTLYEEMSNGLLRVTGQVYGWIPGANPRTYYLDACGTTSNALDCATGRARMYQWFTGALAALDPSVDFGQYDNDGPDGIPNSGDDDGIVDVVQFVQPVVGGECGGRGIWAHKFSLAGLGGLYVTNDPSARGGTIKIGPYHVVGGVGGLSCIDTTQIMGIGTASHELGHGLGLPDLYDVSGQTQGVGEWGLMGSANYRSLLSPGHFEAWSKERLGWVLVRELTAPGTYSLGPVVPSDTVFLIRPRGANPRGEYFLLENKQAFGSDVYNLTVGGSSTGPKQGGLLIWHIDSLKIATTGLGQTNSVNAGVPHGVQLIQADSLNQLDKPPSSGGNRGDAGDPYPGRTGNRRLARSTNPAALLNDEGRYAGFGLLDIQQVAPNGPISFRFGYATVVRASDTLASISVGGVSYRRYEDVLSADTGVTVSVADTQTTLDGRARFRFVSWSDGGARTHTITAASVGDSLMATLEASYQLRIATSGAGTVATSPAADVALGTFFPAGTTVRLVATAGADSVFEGWSGDTTAAQDTLVLTMRRPYTLAAQFVPVLAVASLNPPAALVGTPYNYDLAAQGGTGVYTWSVASGTLPRGLYLLPTGPIRGTPEEAGTSDVTLLVNSGSQARLVPMRLSVAAPAVDVTVAVNQLLRLDTALTPEQVRYLDMLGNRNQRFDLGDFLAWVKKTGVKPPAQAMAALSSPAAEPASRRGSRKEKP